MIDSDDDSPVKRVTSQPSDDDDLVVTISPQPRPHKMSGHTSQSTTNSFSQQRQTTPQKQVVFSAVQRNQNVPSYQTSPFSQQSSRSGSSSSSPWLSKTYGQQNGHVPALARFVHN